MNGITKVATIAPTVLAASSRPAFEATCRGSSPSSIDEAGNVNPMMSVAGRTTDRIGPTIASADARGWLGSSGPGLLMTRTETQDRQGGDEDLGNGDQGDRMPDSMPDAREDHRSESDAEQEHRQDHREDVGRVPRSG